MILPEIRRTFFAGSSSRVAMHQKANGAGSAPRRSATLTNGSRD
jgi:hypothetical protein